MNNIVMFPHVGSGNHGCEAIVRSTVKIFSDDRLTLFSDRPEEDSKYMSDVEVARLFATSEIKRFSKRYFSSIIKKYVLGQKDAFDKETFRPLLMNTSRGDVLLSIGGDLYCYDAPDYIYRVNRYVRNQGCKTVLWGCSVEPSYIDSQMEEDLKGYDLICAREPITYEALKRINPHTILMADPAFQLSTKEVPLPAQSYIGINISPMIQKREKYAGITIENYRRLIQYILDTSNDTVALIPHVVWSSNDDRSALQQLKDMFLDNERVVMVEDHNCVEQKYIIANCKIFVGARTHATIAAYSSCVPTLVVGYSVKARGIAQDLFGTHEKYVLPVQKLKNPNDLTNAYKWIFDRENEIREHLKTIMPEYKERVWIAVNEVRKLR